MNSGDLKGVLHMKVQAGGGGERARERRREGGHVIGEWRREPHWCRRRHRMDAD